MKAHIFPGQGSQAKGMGEGLFEAFPEHTEVANNILGYAIEELCMRDPRGELHSTEYTQPALFVVNALHYFHHEQTSGSKPDYLAGHSLGEYNALMAAGSISFEQGVRIVKERGRVIGQAKQGGMAAVMNTTIDRVRQILASEGDNVDIAIVNSATQVVISGPSDHLRKLEGVFSEGDSVFYPLNTSGAFHSRYMNVARSEFHKFLVTQPIVEPRIPVISNVTALPHSFVDELITHLCDHITQPVMWYDSVRYLLAQGVSEFTELGYGDVLTKLVASIRENEPQAVALVRPLVNEQAESSSGSVVDKVQNWNQRYPVGTRIVSPLAQGERLSTRTEAMVLFGHRAAIYVEGYNGYFDLDEIRPE